MRITLTHHARDQMRERDIAEAAVRETIHSPVATYPTPQKSVCYEGTIGGQILRVWLVAEALTQGVAIVKSAAWKNR